MKKIFLVSIFFVLFFEITAQIDIIVESGPPPPPPSMKKKKKKNINNAGFFNLEINTNPFISKSLTNFFPDSVILKSQKKYPVYASGDYNDDKIRDIAILTKLEDTVQLSIIHRDLKGEKVEVFKSKNLTKKILSNSKYGTQLSTRSNVVHLNNKGKVISLLKLNYLMEDYGLELFFYFNHTIKKYCVAESRYTIYKNKEENEKTVILKDFKNQEKQIILLSDLNFDYLMKIIK